MGNSQIKVELQEFMGSDRSIAESAWTSSLTLEGKERRTDEDVKRIVNMLADSGHSTPFESVVFRFWMRLPISMDRQHMTHRIASHNGMSGRYRTMPLEFLKVPDDVQAISEKVRYEWDRDRGKGFIWNYEEQCQASNDTYEYIILHLKEAEKDRLITNKEFKRAREFYRGVLPQNNMTERTTLMNLRSFANYQKLRNDDAAQAEIHFGAQAMLDEVVKANVCPIALEALKRNKWVI